MVCAPQQQRKICLVNHKIIFPEVQAEFIANQRVLAGHFQWGESSDQRIVKHEYSNTQCQVTLSHFARRDATHRYVRACFACPQIDGRFELALEAEESVFAVGAQYTGVGQWPRAVQCLSYLSAKSVPMSPITGTLQATTPSQLDRVTAFSAYPNLAPFYTSV